MSGALSLRSSTQAQADFRRITDELSSLQQQVASGMKADNLQGFGGGAARLLTAKSLLASASARGGVIDQIGARLEVQALALGQVEGATAALSQAIRQAIAAGDGRGINIELDLAFSSAVTALNESWNGQPLFAGERQDGGPVRVTSVAQLQAAATPADIYDEAARRQTVDLGYGTPVDVAPKASELADGLFDAFVDLKGMIDGGLGQPISAGQQAQLMDIVVRLESEAAALNTESGRTGQLQKRLEDDRSRLQERTNMLTKEIGDQADVNLAEVSIRLSALTAQYQVAARTFGDLSKLSLLDYL
jgi:flagellar hook-associated protein 3 FlgL